MSETENTFEFSLTSEEYRLLNLMAGVAIGCMMSRDEKKLAYNFLRLMNRINEGKSDWMPYAIPQEFEDR